MSTDIRMILTDMDGTLLSSNRTVSPANRKAISDAREAGIETAIATGRLDLLVGTYVRQLELVLPVISCNGALIRKLPDREPVYMNPLMTHTASAVLNWCLDRHVDCLAYTPERVWYPTGSRRIAFFREYNEMARIERTEPVPLRAYGREDLPSIISEGVFKLFVSRIVDRDIDRITTALRRDVPGVETVSSIPGTVDVIAPGASKGDALERLAAYAGITPRQVAVFGDNRNDVSMFARAGLSFAMANASENVRAQAGLVAPANDEDGFARAVYHYLLGKEGIHA